MSAPLGHYLAYTRPRTIPVTLVMVLTGWLASPQHPRELLPILLDLGLLAAVYSFLLWGGSNAFNSAEDRDEGPVNLLPNPPPLPSGLGAFGLTLQLLGVVASSVFGVRCVALALLATVVSTFYSWRGKASWSGWWRRGKEIPFVDNLINATGCGLGSFLYGWFATGAEPSRAAIWMSVAWTVLLFGGIPTSQIFQLRPGETVATARNWTALLGAERTLRLGAALFALHLSMLAPLARLGVADLLWGSSVLAGAVHSAWWSRAPFTYPYRRMLRQMTLLSVGQLAWALGKAWHPAL